MQDFAYAFAHNAILRSGAADGADTAFEVGASIGKGNMEIYLPWPQFNDCAHDYVQLTAPTEDAMALAAQYHPGWQYLKPAAKKLIARNSHQVLGPQLDDPVDMIVCWTPDGATDKTTGKTGGTGQALRIAADYPQIEVLNLQRPDHLQWVIDAIGDQGLPRS